MKSFAISMILKAVDQVSGPLKGVNGSVATFQKKITSASINTSSAWRQTGDALKSLGTRVALVGGSIFALAKTSSAYGDEVNDTANMLGMSTDALQSYRYIGRLAGVEVEEMDKALEKMTVNLGKSESGTGTAKKALNALGITAEKLKAAGPDKSLMVIADAFAKVKDPSVKASIAVDLFGRAGVGMVNVLSEGSAGLEKMQERAKALGIVLDADGIKTAADFDDAWQEVSMTLGGLKNILGVSLLPAMKRGIESVTEWVVKLRGWAKENPALASTLGKVALGLSGLVIFGGPIAKTVYSVVNLALALGKLKSAISAAGGLGKLFSSFGSGAGKFILIAAAIGAAAYLIYKNWDKIGPVVTRVLTAIKPFAPVIAGATAAIWAMNIAMGANPIGLIIVGVATLIAGIIALVKNWDKVKTAFIAGIQQIGAFFSGVWEGIKTGALAAFGVIKKALFTVADALLTVFGGVVTAILGAASKVGKLIGLDTSGLDAVVGKISALQNSVRSQSFIGDIPGARPAAAPQPVQVGQGARAQASATTRQVNDSAVTVRFDNLPRGTSVMPTKTSGGLSLEMGYAGASY